MNIKNLKKLVNTGDFVIFSLFITVKKILKKKLRRIEILNEIDKMSLLNLTI